MKNMWIVPFMFLAMFWYLMATIYYPPTNFYNTDTINLNYPALLPLLSALSFAVYFFLLRMLKSSLQNARLEADIAAVNRQLELQSEHYKKLQIHIEETKKARHDLRHHLSVIQAFISTGEKEKLTEYISEYKTLPDGSYQTIRDLFGKKLVKIVVMHLRTIFVMSRKWLRQEIL